MKLNELFNKLSAEIGKVSENSFFEAKELLKHICGYSETEFLLNRSSEVKESLLDEISESVRKRLDGMPLQYIIGEWGFMGNTFTVGEGVLIPRPETEILCQLVIDSASELNNPVVFDLCSGSGCIALSIKNALPASEVYAVEKSREAFRYLEINAERLCSDNPVKIINGDIFDTEYYKNLPHADIIVSNPPYINSDEIAILQKEVLREPRMALDGGADGLLFYRFIISEWKKHLKKDGMFAFECGENQARDISLILVENGFDTFIMKDYNDIERIVIGRRQK